MLRFFSQNYEEKKIFLRGTTKKKKNGENIWHFPHLLRNRFFSPSRKISNYIDETSLFLSKKNCLIFTCKSHFLSFVGVEPSKNILHRKGASSTGAQRAVFLSPPPLSSSSSGGEEVPISVQGRLEKEEEERGGVRA